MGNFLYNLDGKFKIAGLSIFILALFGIVALTINIDEKQLINVSIVIIGILFLTLIVLFNKTKNTIRYFSLVIVVLTVLIVTTQKTFIQNVFESFLSSYFPQYINNFNLIEASPFLTQISVMIFVLVALFIVNYFMQDNTAMGISKTPIDDIVPESSIKEQMQRVVNALNDDLRSIDIKTNWSIHNFVPLDAEVEVSTGNRKQRKITNLLNAIQKSDDRLFLVLGDPGSGKSVSLRKLARELASESDQTGKIPIYVNLKEWLIDDETKLPTVVDIKSFVLTNILNRDIFVSKFFNKYFDRLYEEGRLYFIFDSFDEIPMLLNESENSERIQHYSEIFLRFLKGARAERSQGVLSSRIFRKPTRDFQVNTILELRPFDDEKIMKMFTNLGTFSEALQLQLFKERHDLVPIARNPFTAQLISDYAEKNNNALPKNQAEMYKSYIISTLESCDDKIKRANLTVDRIFQLSINIAQLMFVEHGFEISKSKLIKHFDRDEIENVINILKFSRLGRVGNDESNFSFVHRRFAEYFIVEQMIENEDREIDYESIPEDSKWRDALVLYCEVASFHKAKEIADFCWKTINEINNPKNLSVIHTVRFLRDAFKGRRECLVDFEEELANYIYNQIDEESDTIQVKMAVESVGLLQERDMDIIISKALFLNNYWISDTALKSCRHLQTVSEELVIGLKHYVFFLPLKLLWKNKSDIDFSFSLSSAFSRNRIYLREYFSITIIYILCIILLLLFMFDIYSKHYVILAIFSLAILSMITTLFKRNIIPNYKIEYESIEEKNVEEKKNFIQQYNIKLMFVTSHLLAIALAVFSVMLVNFNNLKKEELDTSVRIFSLDGHALLLIFLTLITSLSYFIISENKKTSLKIWESFLKMFKERVLYILIEILISIPIYITAIPTYFIILYLIKNSFILILLKIFVENFLFISMISGVILLGKYFLPRLKNWFLLKKAYVDDLSSRMKIQYYYEKLEYDFLQIKLLDYINANYHNIKGEWKDEDILKVSSNKADIYLAQLEEKWRGIEK